ncbi:transposase [Rhizobium laguerreae]|nr:transposase [Rhizobium laguerreae]
MRVKILGEERRRRWDDERKLDIVMSVGLGGATITEVAREHDVTRQQIYAWPRELKKKVCSRHRRYGLRSRRHVSHAWRPRLRGHGHAERLEGLAALAQDVLRQKPTGGAVFVF